MKKRILSLYIIILFAVSVLSTEASSVRAFSKYNQSGALNHSSYSTVREFISPATAEPRTLRVSVRVSLLTAHDRRSSQIQYLMDGGVPNQWKAIPKHIQNADNTGFLLEHEHHPGEEIIEYIHNQDGEKENKNSL